jgi:O-antigen ligase
MASIGISEARTTPVEQTSAASRLVALYVFLLFCRILELLPFFGFGRLRVMLVVTVVALITVFLTGNLVRAIRTPLGVLLIVLTGWMIVCMPFSTWRAESLDQFLNNWLKSLAVFLIIAGLGGTASAFDKVMSAMGWAAAAACIGVLPGIPSAGDGNGVNDRLYGIGTLSNPNEIAFHLWLGMAFLLLLAVRRGAVKKWLLFGVCGFELVLILKTVSREGLLLALLVVLFAVLRVSFVNKIKLVAAGVLFCCIALTTLSPEAMDRYLTLFTSKVSGEAAQSAAASSRLRHQKLRESIELTIRHPIFGVGMGVFMPASVDIAKESGHRGDWEVSHNSYTQVSSELGIPGILLLLAIYVTAFRQVWRVGRAARRQGREDVWQTSFVLLLGLTVLCVHFCFDSMAYVFYMPLVTGLIAAFALAYQDIGATVDDVPLLESGAETQPAASRLVGTYSSRNPYRFGRRR